MWIQVLLQISFTVIYCITVYDFRKALIVQKNPNFVFSEISISACFTHQVDN